MGLCYSCGLNLPEPEFSDSAACAASELAFTSCAQQPSEMQRTNACPCQDVPSQPCVAGPAPASMPSRPRSCPRPSPKAQVAASCAMHSKPLLSLLSQQLQGTPFSEQRLSKAQSSSILYSCRARVPTAHELQNLAPEEAKTCGVRWEDSVAPPATPASQSHARHGMLVLRAVPACISLPREPLHGLRAHRD